MSFKTYFQYLFISVIFVNYIIITNANIVYNCETSLDQSEDCRQQFASLNNSQDSIQVKNSSKFFKNLNNYIKDKKDLFNSGNDFVENRIKSFRQIFSKFITKPIELRLKKSVYDFVVSLNISEDCFQSLLRINNDFMDGQYWALECKLSELLNLLPMITLFE